MNNKMRFYRINNNYLKYLLQYEPSIAVEQLKIGRPYIGIIFEQNNMCYFAPLHTPKPKHYKMNEATDFLKLYTNKGEMISVINFNNMIPVPKTQLININFNQESEKKRNLFLKQYKAVSSEQPKIKSKAANTYNLFTTQPDNALSKRCYNFKLLEEKCKEFENSLNKENIQKNKCKNKAKKCTICFLMMI